MVERAAVAKEGLIRLDAGVPQQLPAPLFEASRTSRVASSA